MISLDRSGAPLEWLYVPGYTRDEVGRYLGTKLKQGNGWTVCNGPGTGALVGEWQVY